MSEPHTGTARPVSDTSSCEPGLDLTFLRGAVDNWQMPHSDRPESCFVRENRLDKWRGKYIGNFDEDTLKFSEFLSEAQTELDRFTNGAFGGRPESAKGVQGTEPRRARPSHAMLRSLQGSVAKEAVKVAIGQMTHSLLNLPHAVKDLLEAKGKEEASMERGSNDEDFTTVLDAARNAYNKLNEVNMSTTFNSASVAGGNSALNECMAALATATVPVAQLREDFLVRKKAWVAEQGVIDAIRATSTALISARAAVAWYNEDIEPKKELLK